MLLRSDLTPSPNREPGLVRESSGHWGAGTGSQMETRLSTERIVGLLRQADVELGDGATVSDVCRRLGISEQRYYRWRTGHRREAVVAVGWIRK